MRGALAGDFRAGRAVRRSIQQKIAETLFEQRLIDANQRQVGVELDRNGVFADAVGHKIDRRLNQLRDIAPIEIGMNHTGVDAGHIEQIVDYAAQTTQR